MTGDLAAGPRVVAVLGATGGTGSAIVSRLLGAGVAVRAGVRSPAAAARLRDQGADPVELDLATAGPDVLRDALAGVDAVVNAAASRAMVSTRDTKQVDRDGVGRAVVAAERAGVRRWIQISMMGSDNPSVVPLFLRRIAAVKGQADAIVTGSALCWTVIRPPWLTDGAGTGRVTIARNLQGGSLPRHDLAAVAITCLDTSASHGAVFDVTSGPTDLSTALAALA